MSTYNIHLNPLSALLGVFHIAFIIIFGLTGDIEAGIWAIIMGIQFTCLIVVSETDKEDTIQ